eukprot:TRINITY_DN7914_c0_g1_i1.p1 TRINITY_DN7914_c0_g1~~TRINITY_DN7914_c0_g1_i1.p1  ORF type:complete len:232 (-),score=26.11 TRINITY_DN7914_c0_g1_i1:53-748(-)
MQSMWTAGFARDIPTNLPTLTPTPQHNTPSSCAHIFGLTQQTKAKTETVKSPESLKALIVKYMIEDPSLPEILAILPPALKDELYNTFICPVCSEVCFETPCGRCERELHTCNVSDCGIKQNLWLCLTCGTAHCSRFTHDGSGRGHALAHNMTTTHPLVARIGTLTSDATKAEVHCYRCDRFVHDDQLAMHLARFDYALAGFTASEATYHELEQRYNGTRPPPPVYFAFRS